MEDLKEYLDKLRDNVDIVSVVSRYVKLKKRGRNFVGLCPFHDEKTPSFVVSPEKQIFHCFGCGASGDVVKFIMRIEDMDFKTALIKLARESGIQAPHFSATAKDNASERNNLKEVMKFAANFFRSQMNESVLHYLKDRGVNEKSIERFGIGFAPNSGNKLVDFAKQKGISVNLLQKVGLARVDDNKKLHSYFWNRIVLPIFDLHGGIMAFGGRIFGKGEPKYLNSPDTVLFTKGNLLYPINIAKNGIMKKKSVVVVEGYFDALILQQEGIDNAVSSMGTSFTDAQAKLIKRFADTVYFFYDDDAAGIKGAERAVEVCSARNLIVKIVVSFGGLDPDEIILKYGKDKIQQMIRDARDPLEFIAQVELKNEGDTPQGRSRVVQKLIETVSKIASGTESYEYIKQIGNIFDIDTKVIIDQYNTQRKAYRRRLKKDSMPMKLNKIIDTERLLTQAVIQMPDYLSIIVSQLNVEEFFDPEYKNIFLKAKEDIENGRAPDPKNWGGLSDRELSIGMELSLNEMSLVSEAAIQQTIDNVKKDLFYRSKAVELFNDFKETGDIEKIKEYNEVLRKLNGR